ncbi:MAG TPA: hypothetical protein VF746_32355 [Longimicrobium sp.]|jgi:hypothetical protein
MRFDRSYPEPLPPSPELSAWIQRQIDALAADARENWLMRLCMERNAFPLSGNQVYLWAIRPDGVVLWIDHESFAHATEPETDLSALYAALVLGARRHPELRELIPARPADARLCDVCGGTGGPVTPAAPAVEDICHGCDGLGWLVPGPPR